ncbi:hypothetical protein [Sandaracinus amylolyticus]|uniref:hypothetical protein n=1 Tax=Sandaracinus amylolyticus TaxID=927083 RepID=UPI0012ECBC1E|nr:hypothetical protein [Sandaracinus amylolyticus]
MRSRLLFALLLAVGCGDDPVRILDGACAFADEHRIAIPDGPVIDDLAIASDGDRVLAVWSERAGAFVRALDAHGAPSGEATRIGPSCEGGLAAVVHDGALHVACGRRGREGRDDEGGVQLYVVREGAVSARASLGAMGRDGSGVSVAIDAQGAPWLGWQEAEGAVSEAWIARASDGATTERLSSPRFRASRPALLASGDRVLATWAETWLDRDGDVEGRVMLRAGARAARPVADLAFDASLPMLRDGVAGDVVLGFRDRRPGGSRPRFQIARVQSDATAIDRIESAAHANATGASTTIACGGDVFVIAPRTHSRTERLVSVRRYTRELEARGPEMQIYEHGAAFEHADATCVGDHVVVLFASRRSQLQQQGSVRAVAVNCASE